MSSTPPVTPAPSASPQTPTAGGPPAAPPAKGGGGKVFLWIFGGCATIVVLGIVVMAGLFFFGLHKMKQAGLDPELLKKNPVLAMAKMGVAGNPDLEMLSSNDDAGTIVIRDKKTGKVATLKFDPEKKSMEVFDENGKKSSMRFDSSKNSLVVTDDTGKTATITADAQAGNVEVNGPDGNFKMGANAGNAPDWVPVYPGASSKLGMSASSNGEQTGSYSFVTKDAVDKVLAYYESALKSSGMKTSNTISNSNGKIAGIASGTSESDKRTVVVSATGEDEGTRVGVTFSSKQ